MWRYWARNTEFPNGHCGLVFQHCCLNFYMWSCYNHMFHNNFLGLKKSGCHIFFKGVAYQAPHPILPNFAKSPCRIGLMEKLTGKSSTQMKMGFYFFLLITKICFDFFCHVLSYFVSFHTSRNVYCWAMSYVMSCKMLFYIICHVMLYVKSCHMLCHVKCNFISYVMLCYMSSHVICYVL